jgi:AcrR family transcriptional regulator
MDKKAIQRKRMERYLIEAAKTIIQEEGAEAVTVRKVADLAGYSYATMYNYFKDVNELLWYVAADYLDELVALMEDLEEETAKGVDGIKKAYRAYVSYYMKNPAVYRFAFFQQLGEPPEEVAKKLQTPVMAEKQVHVLSHYVEKGLLRKEDVPRVGELLSGFVHGLLLFYFSGRMQLDREEMLTKIDQTIEFLLKKR